MTTYEIISITLSFASLITSIISLFFIHQVKNEIGKTIVKQKVRENNGTMTGVNYDG